MSEDRCLARLEDLTQENDLLYSTLEEIKVCIENVLEGKVENLIEAKKIKTLIEEIL